MFMKKIILAGIFSISVLVSCEKGAKNVKGSAASEKTVVDEPVSKECYSAIVKRDTILMTLNTKGNQLISGKLSYNFYEKDKNFGTLTGKIKGDTLFADYAFMSEGIATVRQVVFLKKGNSFVEGFGEVVADTNGKVTFKDAKRLQFEGSIVLSKVDCGM